jgi:hypothetical protein
VTVSVLHWTCVPCREREREGGREEKREGERRGERGGEEGERGEEVLWFGCGSPL